MMYVCTATTSNLKAGQVHMSHIAVSKCCYCQFCKDTKADLQLKIKFKHKETKSDFTFVDVSVLHPK